MSIKLKLNTNGRKRESTEAPGGAAHIPKVTFKSGPGGIRIKPLRKNSAGAPKIKVKAQREHGRGYDSEAEDREEDPYVEEEFILRMKSGPDCDYLAQVIGDRRIGVDANVWIKFKDSRRAVVCVNKHLYAAKLVDLPCIIEANKTLDRRSVFKAADICQMLLVGDRIEHEDIALPPARHSDYVYPHGITPPLRNVRKERFRKRVSHQTIEAVENEVNRLLQLDKEAESTSFEIVDNFAMTRDGSVAGASEAESSFDMLGGRYAGYGKPAEGDEFDDDLLAGQIEQSMMEVDEEHRRIIEGVLGTNGGASRARSSTLQSATATATEESGSEDDDDEDDDDDEASAGEDDGSKQQSAQEIKKLREDLADLANSIAQMNETARTSFNPIIRMRVLEQQRKLEAERDFKMEQLEDLMAPNEEAE